MQFQPGWKLSLFVVLLLPCLIGLGMWQLNRAEEKRNILELIEERRGEGALSMEQLTKRERPAFSQVVLRGRYLTEKSVLLDNKVYRGKFGYEVITPLRTEDGGLWLVSRGWTAGSLDRSELPSIKAVTGEVDIQGEVYVPLGEAFTLGDTVFPEGWPKRLQTLDVDALSEALGEPIYPYVIRLSESGSGALEQHWQDVNILPQKHTGYAVQWFAMAATLIILYLAVAFGLLRSKTV